MIVQRPLPDSINKQNVTNAIDSEKDIDGFAPESKYEVPVWLAAKKLTAESLWNLNINKNWRELKFVVVGKGETAGGPTIRGLRKLGVEPEIVDSKTQNPDEAIKKGDIVITCAGKPGIINSGNIKNGAILIGVGTRGEDGRLRGDYNEEEIKDIAASYTPTPGGVGPVNLSYLFQNLIDAAETTA
jgi:methylenetetrahydrofolate dehydrogenase (NADP+)/methenyltetrahydrofolate cyclohydrolase